MEVGFVWKFKHNFFQIFQWRNVLDIKQVYGHVMGFIDNTYFRCFLPLWLIRNECIKSAYGAFWWLYYALIHSRLCITIDYPSHIVIFFIYIYDGLLYCKHTLKHVILFPCFNMWSFKMSIDYLGEFPLHKVQTSVSCVRFCTTTSVFPSFLFHSCLGL